MEVLHESERTRIRRLYLPSATAIRKELLGSDGPDRLRHELRILRRLRGVPGIVQLIDSPEYPDSILVADVSGTSLARIPTPVDSDELIRLAARLATVLAGMHQRGVVHRDIAPTNILLSPDGAPWLVDFALARLLDESRPEVGQHTGIVGTLAYLAPELTLRTGQPVDQRADLYAFGATLYELATGVPPFGSGNPLHLSHDHLIRVPVSPTEVNLAVPAALSEIVLHLLEKDPDKRYQSAEGVLHDLQRIAAGGSSAGAASIGAASIGAGDAPLRLGPARLVGREMERAALEVAVEDAAVGHCRGVVIAGSAGVGKTALVGELGPAMARRGGWFVAGKFDQYRRDLQSNGVHQVFRMLGRLLLAEPEQTLAAVRERILTTPGANADLMGATIPEFVSVLGVVPSPGDPLTGQLRSQRAGLAVLRAVTSCRPLLVFVDDLQWAGRTALDFIGAVVGAEPPIEDLLLVCTYRLDAHPEAAPAGSLSQLRGRTGVRYLRLDNLPAPEHVSMVAETLRLDAVSAARLAELINPYTRGNPYETIELLNALRREGVLTREGGGWRWDRAAFGARLGRGRIMALTAARLDGIPVQSREVVAAMACLGGWVERRVLRSAIGESATLHQALAPALGAGLLAAEPGPPAALRFQHDRVRAEILELLGPLRRQAFQLAMARRLADVPELFEVAAEQYLHVADALDEAEERRVAAGLMRRAARQAATIGNYARVTSLLSVALRLLDPADAGTLIEVRTLRHRALYCVGRLEEADQEYRDIVRLGGTAVQHVDATCVQIRGLTQRNQLSEALELGLAALAELGVTVPTADLTPAGLGRRFDLLFRWLDAPEPDDPGRMARPESALLAAIRLSEAVLPVAYFTADLPLFGWLSLEALRIWLEHGAGRALFGPAGDAAIAAVAVRGDHAAGYRALLRLLCLVEARGYEPETSLVRLRFALVACWFEPIEHAVVAVRRARKGLVAAGDVANTSYTYFTSLFYLLDCAPSLAEFVTEVAAGLAFVRASGGDHAGQMLENYRWLADVLRGDSSTPAEAAVLTDTSVSPQALYVTHLTRAVASAVLTDQAGLARHTAMATAMESFAPGLYPSAITRLLRGMALAEQVRRADAEYRDGLLSELAKEIRWLAARAADAPDNFAHLSRLLEAEHAWAIGDFRAAAMAFDAARQEVDSRQRPWHRALITERSARFLLAHGMAHAGFHLLTEARAWYAAWGANAKVEQLDWAYPALRARSNSTREQAPPSRATVPIGTLDLLGVLTASQALSSQTSVGGLHARVAEVLGAMSGATEVRLLLWSDEEQIWLLPGHDGSTTRTDGAGHERGLPMSVLRYAQRTGEPVVVADAGRDERFASDPYFGDVECCSLLAVPILGQGRPRAVLLLENHLLHGAFSPDRLDAVKMIAAQLAVSLDNAQLYSELTASRARIVAAADTERRRLERDLHDGAQQRLISLALRLRAAQSAVPDEMVELNGLLDSLVTETTNAMQDLRELTRGLHPLVLAERGLGPALEGLARRSAVAVELDCKVGPRPPVQVEIAAYYVVAEALTNVAKHAGASVVQVQVQQVTMTHGPALRLLVRDDGRGSAAYTPGGGLLGLKDRVEALGGRIRLDSPPEGGTILHAELPIAGDGDPKTS